MKSWRIVQGRHLAEMEHFVECVQQTGRDDHDGLKASVKAVNTAPMRPAEIQGSSRDCRNTGRCFPGQTRRSQIADDELLVKSWHRASAARTWDHCNGRKQAGKRLIVGHEFAGVM